MGVLQGVACFVRHDCKGSHRPSVRNSPGKPEGLVPGIVVVGQFSRDAFYLQVLEPERRQDHLDELQPGYPPPVRHPCVFVVCRFHLPLRPKAEKQGRKGKYQVVQHRSRPPRYYSIVKIIHFRKSRYKPELRYVEPRRLLGVYTFSVSVNPSRGKEI